MVENYNQYSETLYMNCTPEGKPPQSPRKKECECICDNSLPSKNNTTDILIMQIIRELKELKNTTQCTLLKQTNKIDNSVVYIKNNLANTIRELIDSMVKTGEMEEIIETIGIQDIKEIKLDIATINNRLDDLEERIINLENN